MMLFFLHPMLRQGDEDVVDPVHAIREECKMTDDKVKEMLHHYLECKQRVETKDSGACSEYYYDYFYALDSCVRYIYI